MSRILRPTNMRAFRPFNGAGGELRSIAGGSGGPTPDFYAPLTVSLAATLGTATATYTRTNAAYGYDSTLYPESVVADTPRFFSSDGIILEVGGTYTDLEAKDFTTYWSPASGVTVANETGAGPGGEDCSVMTEAAVTSSHRLASSGLTGTAYNKNFIAGVYLKKKTGNGWASIWVTDSTGTHQCRAWFNLNTGALGTLEAAGSANAVEHHIYTGPDGFYLCTLSGNCQLGTSPLYMFIAMADADTSISYAGDTGNAVYVWGASLDGANSRYYYTSPLFSSGSVLSKGQDNLSYNLVPATNDIVFAIDWQPFSDDDIGHTGAVLLASGTSATNEVSIYYDGTNMKMSKIIGGTEYAATYAVTPVYGTIYTVVGRLSSTAGVDIWVNGTQGSNNANTTNAVVGTGTGVANNAGAAGIRAGIFKDLKYFASALTDEQCAAL